MADPNSRQGVSYQESVVRRFVDDHHHREDDAMQDAVAAIEVEGLPPIQVGAGDGAAIALLLAAVDARRVVEVGTLSGYSALWILRAIPQDGRLWSLEADARHAAIARGVFERAGLTDRVELLVGPAMQTLPEIEQHGPFDAVFIDADKLSYPAYGEWALANLRSGGLVLADNAFLFGYLDGRYPDDRISADEIAAMRDFHRLLAHRCPRRACLPTADGLAVGIVP